MSSKRQGGEKLEASRNFRATSSFNDDAIFNYLHSLDTPRALCVWMLYASKEHDQLTELTIDPLSYLHVREFRLDYCATSFLSKASFLKTSFNREEVALKKFHEYELLCSQTNSRFKNPSLDPLYNGSNVWLHHATKRKILEILGDYSGEEFVDHAGWGPGVSTLVKGNEVSAYNKFHAERGITRDLYALVSPWFREAYPDWSSIISAHSEHDNGFLFQVGNAIVTVPKNSKTDRVIAIEPGINQWFQKSIGVMIRRRLLRAGIDLNTQVNNQRLARKGSIDFSLATVDFSSASDSISTEVVRELIPPRWFQLMDACRSKIGTSASGPKQWEKFSSMGNGFTFELESLIFFAAALAVCEKHGLPCEKISVFGDDVIIPNAAFLPYSSFCAYLGFRVNSGKSFFSGYFRESCGSHYFLGVDCKPIFLKEKISYVESFYKLANSIRSLSHRFGFGSHCDKRFLYCWRHLYDGVPELLQLRTPFTAGDVGFASNFDEARPSRARYGIEGFFYTALTSLGVRREADSRAMLTARVWQQSSQRSKLPPLNIKRAAEFFRRDEQSDLMYGNSYTLRGRSKRLVTRSFVHLWYNLGEWAW